MIQFLIDGGPVMIPIGLASVVGLAVFFERIWALRFGRVVPRGVRIELMELARQQRWNDGITLCRKAGAPVCRILEVVLMNQGQPRAVIKELAEEVGKREVAELERHAGIVGTVAAVSPLLGLLGTVLGMILTFDVIQEEGLGVVSSLAGGISQALITTFAGLAVGIPALIGHRYILSRVDDLALILEEQTIEMLELVKGDGGATEQKGGQG